VALGKDRQLWHQRTEALGVFCLLRGRNFCLELPQEKGEALLAQEVEGLADLTLDLTGKLGGFSFQLAEELFRVVRENVVEPGDDLDRVELVWDRFVAQHLEEGAIAAVHEVVVGNEW
jgi:hypothetical protein